MDETLQKNILHELRMIKRLLAHSLVSDDKQIAQIGKLSAVGFQQKEIAALLGITSNTVNTTLNRLKKVKRKNIAKEKQ
ncbi:MAG TPA: hypothetical protein VN604_04895 [Nitrospirota bacterium]|nr:hypothetical protein [Nitrospirota bacterium]